MSSWYPLIKWLHIVSSTVLLGTGAGIAFFYLRAQRTGDTKIIAAVGRDVVLADRVFTATAVVLQPVTGIVLALMAGFPLSSPWLVWSMVLYVLVGCCWLPVVWLQTRMRDLAIVQVSGFIRRVNFKTVYPPPPKKFPWPSTLFYISLGAFDCKDHRMRIDWQDSYYDDGTARKSPGYTNPVLWDPIQPKTVSAADWDLVCGWNGK